MKNMYMVLALVLLASCAQSEQGQELDIKKVVSDAYPTVDIKDIKKIDDNFHEIIINNQIYYATNDGKYLIIGNVIDLETKESITENTKMKQRLSVIESIKKENLIIYKPDKTEYVLTVFTDTSCPYCQKLHDEIPKLLENSIEVRYVLFSRNGDQVEAYKQLVFAYCSENKLESIERLFSGDILDDGDSCVNPLNKNYEYASLLSVEGTPTIFLEDGRIIPGYQNSANIIAFINN
tara:strand:+ start:8604 stop:9311 length:708 start_codon:yes stop_codon:yes gene_type:complete